MNNQKDLFLIVAYVVIFLFICLIAIIVFIVKSKKDRIAVEVKKKEIEVIAQQKTLLLKEIHHRVKNNLQLTSSLLFLQSNKHNNPVVDEMVKESQRHINSIALVHEMLYRDHDFSSIKMQKYLNELMTSLLQFSTNKNINYKIESNSILLPIDYATTIGLILNELVTNSLKHAFETIGGEIQVLLIQIDAENYNFLYADNGKGLPKNVEVNKHTLGTKLVKMFAEEIDADLNIFNENGVRYSFIFKIRK